jgi:hypothetical protein
MAAKAASTHGRRECTVEVSPSEVDAGTALSVTVRVVCPNGGDPTGHVVSIRNRNDIELTTAELTEFDGDACAMTVFALAAPLEVGEHTCRAVLPAQERGGVLYEETSTEFSFATKPHATSMNVWGLPSATAVGERFSFKVGVKCSAGCKLTGRALRVFDERGAEVGGGNLRDDVWPNTTALYFDEVGAQAPLTAGDYEWLVETSRAEQGVAHAISSSTFTVKVVRPPDHEVTVMAFDSESQSPIKGAHILLHPYRAFTDERGMAKVRVAEGTYTLFVSGFRYVPYQSTIEVTSDHTTRAELMLEPDGVEDVR